MLASSCRRMLGAGADRRPDYGVSDDPDTFYAEQGTNLAGLRGWLFRHRVRPLMNRRVAAVRSSALTGSDTSGCATAPAARPQR